MKNMKMTHYFYRKEECNWINIQILIILEILYAFDKALTIRSTFLLQNNFFPKCDDFVTYVKSSAIFLQSFYTQNIKH